VSLPAAPGPPDRQRLRDRLGPFRRRSFSVYWTGGFISNIGTWLQTVAASVFVYQLTGSAFDVGVLNFVSFLPIFLFSVLGGVIGDRFDRRTVVIATHSTSGVLAAILAAISFAGAAAVIHVMVIAFALNTSYAVAKPALVSILPAIVPRDELTEAVGVNTLQFVTGQMIGPVLAAIVIATAGVPWAFAINALTYLGPIVSMVYLGRHGLALGRPGSGVRRAIAAPAESAVGFVREHRWVVALLLGVAACSAPLEVLRTLSPALAQGLGEPESSAGLIVAAQSAGSALALLAFVPLRRSGRSRDVAVFGLLIQAAGLVGTFAAHELWTTALAGGLVGFGFSLCFPVLTSGLQAEVPDAVRGRIMSYHQMFHLGNRPFAALLAGTFAAIVGPPAAVLGGVLLTPVGLLATRRAWRGLDRSRLAEGREPEPTEAELERERAVSTAVAAGAGVPDARAGLPDARAGGPDGSAGPPGISPELPPAGPAG
jgi:MFS family permease